MYQRSHSAPRVSNVFGSKGILLALRCFCCFHFQFWLQRVIFLRDSCRMQGILSFLLFPDTFGLGKWYFLGVSVVFSGFCHFVCLSTLLARESDMSICIFHEMFHQHWCWIRSPPSWAPQAFLRDAWLRENGWISGRTLNGQIFSVFSKWTRLTHLLSFASLFLEPVTLHIKTQPYQGQVVFSLLCFSA